MGTDRPDEFDTIRQLLMPLAGHPAARGLLDDVAVLEPPPGKTLVLTHDTLVAGVHFWPDDPPELIARKLLRVNLSDLAAKGAQPFGYLMSCAWPNSCDWAWRVAFGRGLAQDQTTYGLALLGGDTVSTPGPLTLGATLIGWGLPGRTPRRSTAQIGDALLVTGTIGDGGLGLMATGLNPPTFEPGDAEWLADRYRLPQPRCELANLIAAEATASADISDGLVADVGHIAQASGLGAEIDLGLMPISTAAHRWVSAQDNRPDSLVRLATSGDDYEIAFTLAPERVEAVRIAANALGCPVTVIGQMMEGEGVTTSLGLRRLEIDMPGWRHR